MGAFIETGECYKERAGVVTFHEIEAEKPTANKIKIYPRLKRFISTGKVRSETVAAWAMKCTGMIQKVTARNTIGMRLRLRGIPGQRR
jgi:hypothetical protein